MLKTFFAQFSLATAHAETQLSAPWAPCKLCFLYFLYVSKKILKANKLRGWEGYGEKNEKHLCIFEMMVELLLTCVYQSTVHGVHLHHGMEDPS